MGAPMRPWTIRILELVDAGVEERAAIIRLTEAYVPPGYAYRTRELHRRRLEARRTEARRERLGEEPDLQGPRNRTCWEVHSYGARDVIRRTLWSLAKSGRIVVAGDVVRPGGGPS